MSERSKPKQVCRRSALAFLGRAAAFGVVASSALLTVTEADAQAATPTTPRRRPQIQRSLGQSAVRNDDPREQNDDRIDARDAQSGVRSGARATRAGRSRRTTTTEQKK